MSEVLGFWTSGSSVGMFIEVVGACVVVVVAGGGIGGVTIIVDIVGLSVVVVVVVTMTGPSGCEVFTG